MSATVSPVVTPSGQGILFLFRDAGTSLDSNVTNVVDNNERQSLTLSGNPSGGGFTLTFGGQTTATIPAIPSPPYRYFQWNYTLPGPGTYDLAANLFVGGSGTPNQFYEVFDGSTLLGTATLNNAYATTDPAGAYGGPPNPTPFADNTSPTPLTTHNGNPLNWYPLGAAGSSHPGRFTFSSTALHVRVSCAMEDPAGPYADRDGLAIDNLRIATTDGATVLRVDTAHPPGTLAAPGAQLGTGPTGWQVSDDAHVAIEMAGMGAGVRYLVDPAVVRSSLEAISTVGTGNVTASGDGSPLGPILVTMVGAIGGVAQPLLTASDPTHVAVSSVAKGGLLPSIRKNGGSAIPLPYSWMHYYAGAAYTPGVMFHFPQASAAVAYEGCKHHDNAVQGGWQEANPYSYPGYTKNALAVAGIGPTATYFYRPVGPGDYRASFTWAPEASYSLPGVPFSTDVVYTVRTTDYPLTSNVFSNGSTQLVQGQLLFPVGNPTTVSATASGAVLAVSVVLTGLDGSGNPATETLPAFTPYTDGGFAGSSTVSGSTVFSRIFSASMPAHHDGNATTSLAANPITLGTYHADQSAVPTGPIDQGVRWLVGGTFTLTGLNNGLVVTQSNATANAMVGDAVRFERLTPDTSLTIGPDDDIVYSAGDAWATCRSGTAPAATDQPVANLVGGSIHDPTPSGVTMGVGWNLPASGPNAASVVFNDLLRCAYELQDWPTTLADNSHFWYLSLANQVAGADNRPYPNTPTGRHVLRWTGSWNLTLSTQGGLVNEYATTTYPAGPGQVNQRFYDLQGDAFFGSAVLFLNLIKPLGAGTTVDISGASLLAEGLSPDTAPKFRANAVARFAGMRSIRCMDSAGAIDSNPTEFTDFNPPASYLTTSTPVRTVTVVPHTIEAYTGTLYTPDRNRGQAYLITSTAAHGLSSNQLVLFRGDLVVNLANDLGHATTFNLNGWAAPAYVVDATSFVVAFGLFGELDGSGNRHPYVLTGTVTDPAITITMTAGNGYPLRDQVDLCNAAGCSMYWNMAPTASDDCLAQFGTYLAQHLDPGLKLYLAYHNETWNFNNIAFSISAGANAAIYHAASDDATVFTCEGSRHVWQVVGDAWVAAGRDRADFVRVLEGQWGYTGRGGSLAAYCHSRGITFDAFSIAPYYNNEPANAPAQSQFSPTITRLTADQHLDMLDFHYSHGGYEDGFPGHRAALTGAATTDGVTTHAYPEFLDVPMVTYEGGPQTMTLQGGSGWNAGRLSHQVIRHPRWFGIDQAILTKFQDSRGPGTGCTLFQDYLLSYVQQGSSQGFAQWSAYDHTAQLPYTPGDPAQDAVQVNQFDDMTRVRSVTGGALLDFASRLNATVTPDYSVAVAGSGNLTRGSTATRTVTLTASGGYTGTATLSATGLPTGVTPAFSPTSVTGGGTVVSTLTLTASGSATLGGATITVTATDSGNSLAHAATSGLTVVAAVVPDYSVAVAGSGPLTQGATATRTVTLTALNGYTGTATLSATGLPTGVTAAFAPTAVTGGGTVVSTLTLTASGSATVGSSTVTVTATDSANSLAHAGTSSLTVVSSTAPDFAMSLGGASAVAPSGTATISATMAPTGGYAGSATLGAPSGLPSGLTAAAWSPTALAGSGTLTATCLLTAGPSVVPGTYTVTVTATDTPGSLARSASGPITVTSSSPPPPAATSRPRRFLPNRRR